MADVAIRTEDWRALPWHDYQRNVYRLQKRILRLRSGQVYQATRQGDWKRVHSLQRLLLRSWSARCLAVRQVTQDNRGKRTPGMDGVASLKPEERLTYARQLRYLTRWTVDPIRRTYIPKPNNPTEKRGLGIPICHAYCTSYNGFWDSRQISVKSAKKNHPASARVGEFEISTRSNSL